MDKNVEKDFDSLNRLTYYNVKGVKQHPKIEVSQKECLREITAHPLSVISWDVDEDNVLFRFDTQTKLDTPHGRFLYGDPDVFMPIIEEFINTHKKSC
jgi:hypothetical protein